MRQAMAQALYQRHSKKLEAIAKAFDEPIICRVMMLQQDYRFRAQLDFILGELDGRPFYTAED